MKHLEEVNYTPVSGIEIYVVKHTSNYFARLFHLL